jgi:hypothetical protein
VLLLLLLLLLSLTVFSPDGAGNIDGDAGDAEMIDSAPYSRGYASRNLLKLHGSRHSVASLVRL